MNFEQNGSCDQKILHTLKYLISSLEQDLVVYSTNNSMKVQLFTDSAVSSAGFLASWESIDIDVDIDNINEISQQGYVLSFPQTFTGKP